MTIEILINNQTFYLKVDNLRHEKNNEIQEFEDKFTAYISYKKPNNLFIGEQIKDNNGQIIIFNSIEEVKHFVKQKFRADF